LSTRTSSRKGRRSKPAETRGADPGATGAPAALRWIREVLCRPLGLERRNDKVRVVPGERRRAPPADPPPALSQLRDDLRARLLAEGNDQAPQLMRHLVFVHGELGRKGWQGLEALPPKVIGMALVQAEMLASRDLSPSLATIIDRLRALKQSADAREERRLQLQNLDRGEHLEVTEATHEEFDALERGWLGTAPDPLAASDRAE
jgi:hypothetical protein